VSLHAILNHNIAKLLCPIHSQELLIGTYSGRAMAPILDVENTLESLA